MLPMKIQDCIDMVECALKAHVTSRVIARSWDRVGTDLLPDLKSPMSLSSGLKKAYLQTPGEQDLEEIAKLWMEGRRRGRIVEMPGRLSRHALFVRRYYQTQHGKLQTGRTKE